MSYVNVTEDTTGSGGGTSSIGGLDTHKVGFTLTQTTSGTIAKPLNTSGMKITQHTITNNGIYGGTSQTNTGWTNGANALGTHDAVNATVTSSATAATGGALILTYTALTGKTALTISSVTLDLYGSQAGTLAANGSYKYEYSINGGTNYTQIGSTQTGNFTNILGTDLTSIIAGNWNNLANFRVRVTAAYPAGTVGVTATLDAVELKVTASVTTLQ